MTVPTIKRSQSGGKRFAAAPDIVVATSIPPKVSRRDDGREIGPEYQRHCIETWIKAGFRVLSLNAPEEIPELALRYPAVRFIAIHRDASAISGRRNPLLADLIATLARQPEPLAGIVNADIFIDPDKNWREIIGASIRDAIVVASRADLRSLAATDYRIYRQGFDLFFFEKAAIPPGLRPPFAMGLPWWDYWLPIAFRLQGAQIKILTEPLAFHLRHPANFDLTVFRHMAKEFVDFVLSAPNATSDHTGRDLASIVALCRAISATPDALDDRVMRKSALTELRDKMIDSTRWLTPLWRRAINFRSQDALLYRLCDACAVALSEHAAD